MSCWLWFRRRVGPAVGHPLTPRRWVSRFLSVLVILYGGGLVIAQPASSGSRVSRAAATVEGETGNAWLHGAARPSAAATSALPAATAVPAPAPPSVADAAPLGSHEVFGFAPYWTLDQSGGFDLAGLTTVAYFSVDVNPNGSLQESGSAWNGYESQALANLVTSAHAAGDRVVLTVSDFDQRSLDQLTSSAAAQATMAATLVSAIAAKNLDGVNLDLEGEGPADQVGLTNLVTVVAGAVHQANPHWQVTMDTYASSAGDPDGFYDIPALANVVDGFFVMQYSPNVSGTAQAASPLTSDLFSDQEAAEQYAAVIPADKVILGAPFYGEVWPTTGNTLSATATGPATPIADSQVVPAGAPTYWDAVTGTAWSAYQVGSQWYEAFFDNPTALYDVAEIAQANGLGGVGIWALGMDGNNPDMVSALDGNAQVAKAPPPGPMVVIPATSSATTTPTGSSSAAVADTPSPAPSNPPDTPSSPVTTTTTTTTTTPPGTSGGTSAGSSFAYAGMWDGVAVTLTPAPTVTSSSLEEPGAVLLSVLTDFATTDPKYECLATSSSLAVWQLPSTGSSPSSPTTTTSTTTTTTTTTTIPGAPSQVEAIYTVVALEPTDCLQASFTFPQPATPPPTTTSP